MLDLEIPHVLCRFFRRRRYLRLRGRRFFLHLLRCCVLGKLLRVLDELGCARYVLPQDLRYIDTLVQVSLAGKDRVSEKLN